MSVRCPVCGRAGLQSEIAECPQCNADLEAFQLLDALQEEETAPRTGAERGVSGAARIGFDEPPSAVVRAPAPSLARFGIPVASVILLLGLGLGYLFARQTSVAPVFARGGPSASEFRAMQQQLRDVQARVTRLDEATRHRLDPLSDLGDRLTPLAEGLPLLATRADLAALGERLSLLEKDLRQRAQRTSTPAPAAPEPGPSPRPSSDESVIAAPAEPASAERPEMRMHRLVRGDTLWEIAATRYGAGDLYPVLLALNPGLGVFFPPGREIRLPESADQARRLLAEMIVEHKGQRAIRYTSIEGDTWQAISRRLYGHSQAAARLKRFNGGGRPEPGTPVMVPLVHRLKE